MNDRASAAPPVHFIGLQHCVPFDRPDVVATIRPVTSHGPNPPSPQFQEQQQPPLPAAGKRGSKQFLGQVWDGVMDKLRIKRDTAPEKKQPQQQPPAAATQQDDRPSKDEVYANYQQLLASGFFSSHAIQSTRQPGPHARPSTSAGRPSSAHPHSACSGLAPPQWPLPQGPLTPTSARASSPIRSPTSASSRGTKRAVQHDEDNHDDHDQPKSHKKLRKTASSVTRDMAMPRFRSSSRLTSSRSFSNATGSIRNVSAAQGQTAAGAPREVNKLAKRVLGRLPLHVPDRGSSARRNLSETFGIGKLQPSSSSQDGASGTPAAVAATPDRALRPKRSTAGEPLRVRPNANRGIPSVPDIPAKFTFGEDRENDGPWRGLRRHGNTSFCHS